MNQRPEFKDILSYDEFAKYYWYREELQQICKGLGANYNANKSELMLSIKQFFEGEPIVNTKKQIKLKAFEGDLTLDTRLLDCSFCFNQKFRDFFSVQTGLKSFKFNTDMVATAKKVKEDKDVAFTLGDLLDIYYGKKEYAKFDNSSCQWNKFLKDFCEDQNSNIFSNKLKVASILWTEVRNSTNEKVYTKDLINDFADKVKDYQRR